MRGSTDRPITPSAEFVLTATGGIMGTAEAFGTLLNACDPLNLVDVGARWGANPRWEALASKVQTICFEPDGDECARLAAKAPPHVRYLPYGLAEHSGPQTLYITQQPACSSIYPPVSGLYNHYPSLSEIRPVRALDIDCRSLDEIATMEKLDGITAIKLDTQGSELDILRGSKNVLKHCCLVDIEVEFNPLYEGQGLFCDVDRFLRDRDFVLWRFENLVHYAPNDVHAARTQVTISNEPRHDSIETTGGQLFWAQAQYVRAKYPRTSDLPIPEKEGLRAALVAGLYGFWDLAIEITRKMPTPALHDALLSELSNRPE
ncbi:methyltransferase, FkbM family [Methylobacterium sp. UNC378MF]|uniref:FkbM family methyltransferase n=1 Tax=Methylobacterium sp. UNC378MF TaxID=1502748 RepID=UPI000884147D|nr:FkbM family methyltransferase [Methylobacterium sp. UNC378MF]SDA34573.1 methyltransferase, FkbM family [Methylobacterium sp. UNC378MF]